MNCFWIVSLTYWTQRRCAWSGVCRRCELLLDRIFDLLNTTPSLEAPIKPVLWIAFGSYLWLTEHNNLAPAFTFSTVVNCFWIVSLTYWTQLHSITLICVSRCELLLDRIFDLLNTTKRLYDVSPVVLWIAFGSYLWLTEHNSLIRFIIELIVVNCFWIVSLTYWTQQKMKTKLKKSRCELLLDRIFDLLNTTSPKGATTWPMLWIAFGSYLWLTEHNTTTHPVIWWYVVNCFWIVSLTYWTQPDLLSLCVCRCCELLLDRIFDLLNTTKYRDDIEIDELWIAFGSYLWLTEHNKKAAFRKTGSVVNCFWIVSLTYWTQRIWLIREVLHCCELLLDRIFDLLNTTASNLWNTSKKLWIAFGSYLWLTEHNSPFPGETGRCVVNCFWIVSLTYWTQLIEMLHDLKLRCELLLDRIFDLLNTTKDAVLFKINTLWIAFGSYLWLTEHNKENFWKHLVCVVNCFWIVSLTYWTQHGRSSTAWKSVVNCFWIASLTYWTQLYPRARFAFVCCELLLDRIFDLLNTTNQLKTTAMWVLWIAFGSYLWLTEHNHSVKIRQHQVVVNCFWIVSLTYWTQLEPQRTASSNSCELLLDRIFDLLNTTFLAPMFSASALWIAFGSYLWLTEHNTNKFITPAGLVVNCFWIVSLTYWTQRRFYHTSSKIRCELLLDRIFDLLNTTWSIFFSSWLQLWIAFGSYLWLTEHNQRLLVMTLFVLWIAFGSYLWLTEHNDRKVDNLSRTVVNCFWIVSLTYWTQPCPFYPLWCWSCELLLDRIFDLLNTTFSHEWLISILLWIAFGSYLWLTEHNTFQLIQHLKAVVNCFWIVSLTYWTQPLSCLTVGQLRCELLLDRIFDLLNTTIWLSSKAVFTLWIAFGSYLWLTEHNHFPIDSP